MKSPIGFGRDQEPPDDLDLRSHGQLVILAWMCSKLIEATGQREAAMGEIRRLIEETAEASAENTEQYRKGLRDVLKKVESFLRRSDSE